MSERKSLGEPRDCAGIRWHRLRFDFRSVFLLTSLASVSLGLPLATRSAAPGGILGTFERRMEALCPAVDSNGIVYSVDENATVHAIDPRSFQSLWRSHLDWEGQVFNPIVSDSSPVVGTNGLVYVGLMNGKIYALETTNGALRWSAKAGKEIHSTSALGHDGRLYVASDRLVAFDETSGVRLWSALPSNVFGYMSPVVGKDGTVYVVGEDLYAVHGGSGSIKWRVRSLGGGASGTSPAIDSDGTLYLGATERPLRTPKVFAVDGNGGGLKWAVPTGGFVLSSPVLGPDGTLFVGTESSLLAIDRTTGRKLWETKSVSGLGMWDTPAVDAKGVVYVNGTSALVGRTGTTLWTVSEPVGGLGLAIDTAGRLWGSLGAMATGGPGPAPGLWSKHHGNLANDGRVAEVAGTPPKALLQPVSQSAMLGETVSFRVEAENATSYQWLKDLEPMPGATGPVLVFRVQESGMAGSYRAVISNPEGNIVSDPAMLAVQSRQLWRINTGAPVSGCPAVGADNGVYFGSGTSIRALNGEDGSQRWIFPTTGEMGGAVALAPDGQLFAGVCCRPNTFSWSRTILYALKAANGTKVWDLSADMTTTATPSLGANGRLYLPFADGWMYSLRQSSGVWVWRRQYSPKESAPALGEDDTLYWYCRDSEVAAANGDTGELLRKGDFEINPPGASPAIGGDGTVYLVSSQRRTLAAYDGRTGARRWSTATRYGADSGPAIGADGTIFVASAYNDSALEAFDPTTGVRKWALDVPSEWFSSTPTVGADGTVYVSAIGGLYAVDGRTGELLWNVQGAMRSPAALAPNGNLYVGTTNGLIAFRTRSPGLANSSWPKFAATAANSGRIRAIEPEKPRLLEQPSEQRVRMGETAHFSVTAHRAETFQWLRNGEAIPGATLADLVLPAVSLRDDATYSVEVGNRIGVTRSEEAHLTVLFPPELRLTRDPGAPSGFGLSVRAAWNTLWSLEASAEMEQWTSETTVVGRGPGTASRVEVLQDPSAPRRYWRLKAKP